MFCQFEPHVCLSFGASARKCLVFGPRIFHLTTEGIVRHFPLIPFPLSAFPLGILVWWVLCTLLPFGVIGVHIRGCRGTRSEAIHLPDDQGLFVGISLR